jgi:4-alpha-glucanotransferase
MSATPCRLLIVAIEDVLGVVDQINLPGTIDRHPNWRRRLPVTLEALRQGRELGEIARACTRPGSALVGSSRHAPD